MQYGLRQVEQTFTYEVINNLDGKLLSLGETMHGWTNKALKLVNAEKINPTPLPPYLYKLNLYLLRYHIEPELLF